MSDLIGQIVLPATPVPMVTLAPSIMFAIVQEGSLDYMVCLGLQMTWILSMSLSSTYAFIVPLRGGWRATAVQCSPHSYRV